MAIGDLVGTLVAVGGTATSFVLTNNPGGFFAISGSNLIEAVNTPDGIYPITIKAIGPGYQATTSFSLDFTGGQPIPPVQEFFFGLNLSGAENQFPVFPTFAEMQYWVNRGVTHFRIPIGWSRSNPFFGTVGLQPTAFGDLDTTSTYLPLTGNNILYHSQAFTVSPWSTFAGGTGAVTITDNADVAPDGSHTATLVAASRSDTSSYIQLQQIISTTIGLLSEGLQVKASSIADVGKTVTIGYSISSGVIDGLVDIVLTSAWQSVSSTFNMPAGNQPGFLFLPFFHSTLPGTVSALVWGAQMNPGATLNPYQKTDAGYAQALDQVFLNAETLGAKILLDCHTFGSGPGNLPVGDPGLPVSAFADFWAKTGTRYASSTAFYAPDFMNEWVNGFPSATVFSANQAAVLAMRALGFTGPCHIEGTNFSGAWNWVSGEGQPYNNSGLFSLNDPLNNLIFHFHTYLDPDSSGSDFSWSVSISLPGLAPPGVPTSHTIGLTRLNDEVIPWLSQHGVRGCLGEMGVSVDPIANGGANDWGDWIITGRNTVDLCRANNIPVFLWGGGPGFGATYGFNPEPYNPNTGVKDFTPTGVQSVLVAGLIDHYITNPQAQPTAYLVVPPQTVTPTGSPTAPNVVRDYYETIGVASNLLTVIYGGVVASTVTITPHANYTDGTDAGGTFSPPTLALIPGENALAASTYTPANAGTIVLSATNDRGLTDPAGFGISTLVDSFNTIVGVQNVYGLRRLFTPYIGPAIRLQRVSDGQQMDFYFTKAGNLDRNAILSWASQISGIPVVTVYNQIGNGQDVTNVNGVFATLNLSNSAGYPEINHPANAEYHFQTTVGNQTSGNTQQSIIARVSDANNNGFFISQDNVGSTSYFPFRFAPVGYNVNNSSAAVTLNREANVYHTYGGTYINNTATSGLIGYRDGSVISQVTTPNSTGLLSAGSNTTLGYFAFASGNQWLGSWQTLIIESVRISGTQMTAFATSDATYYSTPLPDVLPPVLDGVSNQHVISGTPGTPFGTVNVQDVSGTTETVVITLTGHAATLSGTGLTGSNPYTLGPDTIANINTNMQAIQFSTTGSTGDITHVDMQVTNNLGGTAHGAFDASVVAAVAPTISGLVAPNVAVTQGAPPLWQIVIADPNPSPTVSATITITGSGGTLSHIGPYAPGGTGPYTFGAMTTTELTRALRNLLWAPSVTTVGTTTTFALVVTNNLGLTASASNTITNIAVASMPSALTPVATPAALPRSFKGINFSGGENNPANYPLFSSTWTYAHSKGLNTVRFAYTISHLTDIASSYTRSVLFANLNGQTSSLQAALELGRQNGMYVILDDHSYGGMLNPFPTGTSDDNSFPQWGTDIRVPKEGFADAWQRVISLYQNYPNLILGLQNEPGWITTNYHDLLVGAVNAIRTVSSTVEIYIPGPFSNVTQFNSTYQALWAGYTDPVGGPWLFDVHMYFDSSHSGQLNTCVNNTPGSYFDTFTNWARANSFKGSVTEFGFGRDSSCIGNPNVDPGVPNYFTTNADVYLGWNWFASDDFGPSYFYYIGPQWPGPGDPPQLPALTSNLSNTF